MPYLQTPLMLTLAPAYDMLDRIWKLLQEDGQSIEHEQYRENLFAWAKLNRIWGHAQDQLREW